MAAVPTAVIAAPLKIDTEIVAFGEAMIELSNIEGDHARIAVAGDTFNTAVYLARNGIEVSYATAVGEDAFSQRVVSAVEEEGISTALVRRFSERTVGLYAVSVDEYGERSFTYWRSESAARDALCGHDAGSLEKRMSQAGLLYVSGITLSVLRHEGRDRLNQIARTINQRGGHVVFDTNYRAKGWGSAKEARSVIEQFQPFVTIALPTFEDDCEVFGDRCAEMTAARWAQAGVSEVVVKAGPKGAFLGGHGWVAPSKTVRPIDSTGAGDSFNGAYLAARINGANPVEATKAAHKTAQQVLMTHGAILPPAHALSD